jgi:hypothetical protein
LSCDRLCYIFIIADLPYKKIEEREELEEDFAEIEQDNSEEFEDMY